MNGEQAIVERRLAVLLVTPDLIGSFAKQVTGSGGRAVIEPAENALPADAVYVRSFTDEWRYPATLCLIFASMDFEPIDEAEHLPVLPSPVLSYAVTNGAH